MYINLLKSKIALLITIMFLSFTNANSQQDSTIANYSGKFKVTGSGGLYFTRMEGYTPFINGNMNIGKLNVLGNLNFSTHRKEFTYDFELNYQLIKDKLFVGGSVFDESTSNEEWMVTKMVNTLTGTS